jgi:hypothetical protein
VGSSTPVRRAARRLPDDREATVGCDGGAADRRSLLRDPEDVLHHRFEAANRALGDLVRPELERVRVARRGFLTGREEKGNQQHKVGSHRRSGERVRGYYPRARDLFTVA